jgi:hypothetical protein
MRCCISRVIGVTRLGLECSARCENGKRARFEKEREGEEGLKETRQSQ